MAKFATNASGAIWWPNLQLMHVVPSGGQIFNWCKWRHLVAKFAINASHGVNFWVHCASGNVYFNLFVFFYLIFFFFFISRLFIFLKFNTLNILSFQLFYFFFTFRLFDLLSFCLFIFPSFHLFWQSLMTMTMVVVEVWPIGTEDICVKTSRSELPSASTM